MSQFNSFNSVFRYYGKYNQVRGGLSGLPLWARWILIIVASPGIALIVLSILALLVSILALLLLTVPAYSLLRNLTAGGGSEEAVSVIEPVPEGFDGSRRKHIEATVIDPAE